MTVIHETNILGFSRSEGSGGSLYTLLYGSWMEKSNIYKKLLWKDVKIMSDVKEVTKKSNELEEFEILLLDVAKLSPEKKALVTAYTEGFITSEKRNEKKLTKV